MAGRRPKPTHLRVLEGNPGHRRINKDEPKPTPRVRVPAPPKHLGKEGRAEWRRVGKDLVALGLLTSIDRPALAAYCQAWQRWVGAEEQIEQEGTTQTSPNGYLMQSAYVGIANRAMDQMRKFLIEFGMTPAARSRITVTPPSNDSTGEWLFGNNRNR